MTNEDTFKSSRIKFTSTLSMKKDKETHSNVLGGILLNPWKSRKNSKGTFTKALFPNTLEGNQLMKQEDENFFFLQLHFVVKYLYMMTHVLFSLF